MKDPRDRWDDFRPRLGRPRIGTVFTIIIVFALVAGLNELLEMLP